MWVFGTPQLSVLLGMKEMSGCGEHRKLWWWCVINFGLVVKRKDGK